MLVNKKKNGIQINEINHRLVKSSSIWIIIVCLILNVFWLSLVTQVNLALIL